MINFNLIEDNLEILSQEFREAEPFPFIKIDNFADAEKLSRAIESFPVPGCAKINKSRDYIFAKNKYEKSNFKDLSSECQEIYDDFVSERFQNILIKITGQDVFVDKEFHGGGIHQGGEGSFLDMHVDFNYHPLHHDWFRNLNILLYLNKDWQKEYKGQLRLKHLKTGKYTEVEPIFNRCVIMFTRDYTLHGYDSISFPPNKFRRSIATYAYSLDREPQAQRSTVWMPDKSSIAKKVIGKFWPKLVKVKTSFYVLFSI